MKCDLCPADAVAVAPGEAPERACDLFALSAGAPRRQWCMACWPWRPAVERAA